jgi:hypothetical protein
MRVILGQGVPRDGAALLRERGCDCTHVGEIGMARSSDEEIKTTCHKRPIGGRD